MITVFYLHVYVPGPSSIKSHCNIYILPEAGILSPNCLVFIVFEKHICDLFKFIFFSATIRHLHVAYPEFRTSLQCGRPSYFEQKLFLSKTSSLYRPAMFFQFKRHRSSCSLLCSSNGPIFFIYFFFF